MTTEGLDERSTILQRLTKVVRFGNTLIQRLAQPSLTQLALRVALAVPF